MRKLIGIISLCILATISQAQSFQEIKTNKLLSLKTLRPSRDTLAQLAADSGAIAYKNGSLYVFNGVKWVGSSSAGKVTLTNGGGFISLLAYPHADTVLIKDFEFSPFGYTITEGTRKITFALDTSFGANGTGLTTLAQHYKLRDSLIAFGLGGSGDNWGSAVVNRDATLAGNGTIGTPLKVDTSNIATILQLQKRLNDSSKVLRALGGGSGGSGTVTSFSAGDLSPLFTTSEATATTTPALTFTLNTQSANLVFAGPTTGSAAAPTFRGLVALDIAGLYTDAGLTTTDVTTNNVTSTKHGFAPKSSADATLFLNGATTPAYAAVKDSDLSISDITTNNATTSKHGFLKKLSNSATQYMDGTGNWSTPAGGGGTTDTAYATFDDENYTVSATGVKFHILPDLTFSAGSTSYNVVMPTGTSGRTMYFYNQDTHPTKDWIFTGVDVEDAQGNTISVLQEQRVYELTYAASKWRVSDVYFTNIEKEKSDRRLLSLAGSAAKAWTFGKSHFDISGTLALADGTARYATFEVKETTTVTGVGWFQTVQGNYTADNYNGVALYTMNLSTGDITSVASSTDDGNIWKATAFTFSTKAFSATYKCVPGVVYVIMGLYNSSAQTTAPSIGKYTDLQNTALANNGLSSTNLKLAATNASETTAASSVATASLAASPNLAAFYIY